MYETFYHDKVWPRFVRMPYGHIVDCAEPNGEAYIPTAEEVKNNVPNIVSYGTAIADCAFFGGLYLYGLCIKYELAASERTKEEIYTLVRGLLLLCDVGKKDGFIARGVADDGITHYPMSSEDQVGPWVLGLWKAMCSDATDAALREEIRVRLKKTINGLMKANWKIPTEIEGETLGSFAGKSWRSASMFLLSAAVMRDIGGITTEKFNQLADEKPADSVYSRAEIVSHSYVGDMIRHSYLVQFWITVCAQICAHELITLDPAHAELYKRGKFIGGAPMEPYLTEYKRYIEECNEEFKHDWRVLIPQMEPWKDIKEAFEEAKRINACWSRQNKMRILERTTLCQSVFGAWIAIMSGDKPVADYAYKCLCDCADAIDWDKVGHSYAFAAESAICCYKYLYK